LKAIVIKNKKIIKKKLIREMIAPAIVSQLCVE